MRLWLSKNSDVPLREQLVTQVILGIASSDLAPGQRLPSTRDLARRYQIHSNTVSAAYRELAKRGWVEFRKGSGVYVKSRRPPSAAETNLDDLISTFYKTMRDRGYSLAEVQAGLKRWSSAQPPDHFLVMEPDPDLRRILVAEVKVATGKRVESCNLDLPVGEQLVLGAIPVLMQAHLPELAPALPSGTNLITILTRSVPESMRGERVPETDALIAIVSCWPGFLQRARAVLVAAGVDLAALSFRDGRQPGWQKGLSSSSFVITDSLMAQQLPGDCTARVFRIISEASIAQLCEAAESFPT